MLKAIHAAEDAAAARDKAKAVVEKLKAMKRARAAEMVAETVEDTLAYYRFPDEHWRRIRTNNPLERLTRKFAKGLWTLPYGQGDQTPGAGAAATAT